jgi:hypothetical protein
VFSALVFKIKENLYMNKLIFLLALTFTQLSAASTINSTKITAILAGEVYGNVVLIKISAKPTDIPTCQTNPTLSYAFDPSTVVGKTTLSMALSAYAAGKDVYLNGYNDCNLSPSLGVERLRQIRVQ